MEAPEVGDQHRQMPASPMDFPMFPAQQHLSIQHRHLPVIQGFLHNRLILFFNLESLLNISLIFKNSKHGKIKQ
jgi:hypothetical protein